MEDWCQSWRGARDRLKLAMGSLGPPSAGGGRKLATWIQWAGSGGEDP